ncbi:MAG: hypothetical protein V1859_01525 [archaeon]
MRKNVNKKSEVTSSVFLYIIIALFIGVILFFGIKGVATLTSTGKSVNLENLKSDMKTAISSQATKYMSVKVYEFNVPKAYTEVCFADSKVNNVYSSDVITAAGTKTEGKYALLRDAIESDSDANVFFLDKNGVKESFYADNLDVDANVLCIQNDDMLKFTLRGQGRTSLMTLP